MPLRKHPAEAEVLKLTREGVARAEIAKRLGVTENLVWACRYLDRARSGREASDGQLRIARDVVERWRKRSAAK